MIKNDRSHMYIAHVYSCTKYTIIVLIIINVMLKAHELYRIHITGLDP
jgi:hypothetical protein